MKTCEHCGYRGAVRNWCARCSSIDPLPSRRRILQGAFALLLGAGAVLVCTVPQQIAKVETSKIMARTNSFTASR